MFAAAGISNVADFIIVLFFPDPMSFKFLFYTLLFLACSAFAYGQTTYIFAGTFNRDAAKEGIAVYKLNPANRWLEKTASIRGILNPSFLAIGGDPRYIYACTETQTEHSGYVSSFRFDPSKGTLQFINRQKCSGDNPVYLTTDRDNKFLLSANYTGGALDVFPILADGSIGEMIQTIAYKEGSAATKRQQQAHPHSVIFSPDQDYILVPDLGADLIRSYRFDPLQQQPVIAKSQMLFKAAAASGPRHICFHPNKRNVYCIEEISGTVTNYEALKGRLRVVQKVSLHRGAIGDYNSADIHISPDGKFLYASNRGNENNLAYYRIDPNGILHFVDYHPVLGDHPRMFAISPDGRLLVVANQLSGKLNVFGRNTQSGNLSPTGQRIDMENPSCVQIRTYP